MLVYNNTSGSTGKLQHSSKGNQLKMCLDGKWYKADYLGYESASEYFTSELLKQSNVIDFATYEMCDIVYNNISYNGCVSDNFLKTGEELITLERLFKTHYNRSIFSDIKNMDLEDKISYVVNAIVELTGLDRFGSYLTTLLELDTIILNEDRHFHNIAVIRSDNGMYRYCPIFDNGAAYLSDTRYSYPLEKSYLGLMPTVQSKPFSISFDKQCEACQKLYGRNLSLPKTDDWVKDVCLKIEDMYGKIVSERIHNIFNRQKYLYMEFFDGRQEPPVYSKTSDINNRKFRKCR